MCTSSVDVDEYRFWGGIGEEGLRENHVAFHINDETFEEFFDIGGCEGCYVWEVGRVRNQNINRSKSFLRFSESDVDCGCVDDVRDGSQD